MAKAASQGRTLDFLEAVALVSKGRAVVPTLSIAQEAAATVTGFRVVRMTGTGTLVGHANGNTAAIIGVADRVGAEAGRMCDVHMDGTEDVQLGGTAAAGAPLTANADGCAVASTAGAGRRIVGFALGPGLSGDIIKVRVAPGVHSA